MLTIQKDLKPKNKIKLRQRTEENKAKVKVAEVLTEGKTFRQFPPILFPYQAQFLKDIEETDYNVFVYEKSRRIGITHALAAHAVLSAAKTGGRNFFYISTNRENGKDFIDSCKYWATHFNLACGEVQEDLYEDESKDILTLKINFSSGKRVAALASKPSSVRGLQGDILLDEAAFLTDLESFLKACRAMLIWGAKIFIVSTHNGEENPFNKLVKNILSPKTKEERLDYYHKKTTFQEAIKEGLFKRICLSTNKEWSETEQEEWIRKIYKDSGSSASEELDVIPRANSLQSVFRKENFKRLYPEELPTHFDNLLIAWDTAATEGASSCYTAGILFGKAQENYYVLDWSYCRLDASSTHNFIVDVCKALEMHIPIYLEIEGGSQSLLWLENAFKPALPERRVIGSNPTGSKLLRAIPVAEEVKQGRVFVKECAWTEEFLDTIKQFEGKSGVPLITDTGDALSLAFANINNSIGEIITGATVRKPRGRFGR